MWRKRLQSRFLKAARWLQPKADLAPLVRVTTEALRDSQAEAARLREFTESRSRLFISDLIEAQAMCGSGPWAPGAGAAATVPAQLRETLHLKEAGPVNDATLGAWGTFELLLQNIDWIKEINYSWLEFSRWGIQQIILICRLYYLKNPIVRRLTDVCAGYVFCRGVDVTTQDEDANRVLKDFFERNKKVLGHVALKELEKSKDRDGNLFFAFFSDKATGETDLRMIDATEIQDIVCDPEDSDTPWYYRRLWNTKDFDPTSGRNDTKREEAWYPALGYEPKNPPEVINGKPVRWDVPVYHRRVGAVGKWVFGCPRLYPMLDWAKEARRFLEACASVRQSLAQFAFTVKTKGGQQAMEGIKQQMETTIGPPNPLWDQNPPAVAGSTFISGPGTSLDAFKVQGATFSPEDVRQYKLMCCMVKGVPETFLADVSTGNLATATSLDRPTETVMLDLQEEWVEDLTVIARVALMRSKSAPSGKLREAIRERGEKPADIEVRECARLRLPNGGWQYLEAKKNKGTIDIQVDFPAIREGDVPALIKATVEAMTLDNKGGQIVGIDEKEGVKLLYRQLGVERGDEIAEDQYPDKEYDPDRTAPEQALPAPIPKLKDQPGIQPAPDQVQSAVPDKPAKKAAEALRKVADAIEVTNGSYAR